MQTSDFSNSQIRSGQKSASSPSSFSPCLARSLEVQGARGFLVDAVCFSARHNMIIACPRAGALQFYDANLFLPVKGRGTLKLDSAVEYMSFHPETDSYIMGCTNGSIYLYNATNHELEKVKQCKKIVMAVTFISPTCFAFSEIGSKKLCLGTFDNENPMNFDSHNRNAYSLQHISQRNLLLSGSDNGCLTIYRIDRLPRLPILCSVEAHRDSGMFAHSINVKGKEYIITGGNSKDVKIWHFVKGRIKLLKVIQTEKGTCSIVYLEHYKMIAMASWSKEVKFFSLLSGKLQCAVSLSKNYANYMFLMKEKNMIGITSSSSSFIEFIQLDALLERVE